MSSPLQIRLTIRSKNEHIKVEFAYDPATDTVDRIAAELSETILLTEEELIEAKKTIYAEVEKQILADTTQGPINDPGYRDLIAQQKTELQLLEERHQAEQRDLIARNISPANRSDDLLVFE